MVFETAELFGIPVWLFIIALIWSLIWKGLALWKSARRNSPIWFVAILIINTLGILEILYIFLFSEIKLEPVEQKAKKSSGKAEKPVRKTRRRVK